MHFLSRYTLLPTLLGTALCMPSSAHAQSTPSPDEAFVLGASFGDRGCVLALSHNDAVADIFATFEVCEQDLVGQKVSFFYETIEIPATSCGGDPTCTDTEDVLTATGARAFSPPREATVDTLTSGDRACYVTLTDAAGESHAQFATFEICEQNIVGQTVQLDYDYVNINAYICQGNLECGLSDRALLIKEANVVAAPPPQVDIESLPDGNYRYWSETSINAIVSDDELLLTPKSRLFLFSKQGNTIVGTWAYIDDEAICVEGQVNGNIVTGLAVQTLQGATVRSGNSTFAPFGPAHRLFVRQGRQLAADTVRYGTVLLNLDGLNRINAGTVLPPSGC